MSGMSITHPRLACGLMLAVSSSMCIACVLTIGTGWRTIMVAAMCTSAVVHAVSVPAGRPSDILRFWRMMHVALTIMLMVQMLPDGPPKDPIHFLLPVLGLMPIIALATIRQSIGRSAALVPING